MTGDRCAQIVPGKHFHDQITLVVLLPPVVDADDAGLCRDAAAVASWRKRWAKAESPAYCGSISLTATLRPSTVSSAAQTAAMPPTPIRSFRR